MLPLIDKPIIQYLVEEAAASGIREVILVTRPGVSTIKDHFGQHVTLEKHLLKQEKKEMLCSLKKIGRLAKVTLIQQDPQLPYGTGAPLVTVEKMIKKGEYFIFILGDDLFKAQEPAAKQLLKIWQKDKKAVILGCGQIKRQESQKWGVVKLKKGSKNEVEMMVEKPKPSEAPSTLGSFGRYVLNKEIIDILLKQKKQLPKGREFYLTDAIDTYCRKNKVVVAKIRGKFFTTGDPLNWLKATVEYALARPDLGKEFSQYLKKLTKAL